MLYKLYNQWFRLVHERLELLEISIMVTIFFVLDFVKG